MNKRKLFNTLVPITLSVLMLVFRSSIHGFVLSIKALHRYDIVYIIAYFIFMMVFYFSTMWLGAYGLYNLFFGNKDNNVELNSNPKKESPLEIITLFIGGIACFCSWIYGFSACSLEDFICGIIMFFVVIAVSVLGGVFFAAALKFLNTYLKESRTDKKGNIG